MEPVILKSIAPVFLLAIAASAVSAQSQIPHLQKQGTATQLMVDGRPFLILGGELHNSSSSSLDYMRPVWKRMLDLHFNTVLAGVSWELIEPREGKFDFHLVDGLIHDARQNGLRLVFLWFGSWKNGMSSYMPLWVKQDYKRFARVKINGGKSIEVLSTVCPANWEADRKAFAALMRHIREVDGTDHTVVMMQVENEVGVLGDSRDRSEAANQAFAQPVPKALLDYLAKRRDALYPELRSRWEAAGARTSGTWSEVFGGGTTADEAFMAWNYASYIDKVAEAGKAEYALPMYANTWLSNERLKPGDWPSGCPEPHVMDIWKAAAAHIDILSPDIYAPDFTAWTDRYTRPDNPLFIPEMTRDGSGPRNIFYALGKHEAIGTSPFAVDSIPKPEDSPLAESYAAIAQVAPLILEHQGKGEMTGFVLDKEHPSVKAEMGGYQLEISLDSIFGNTTGSGYGMVIATGKDEFVGVGVGFRVAFTPQTPGPALAGIGSVDEGTFADGKWVPGRRLNGDEDDQGQRWRMGGSKPEVTRCVVYRYE
jgi:beta-galactosidase GanA